MSLPEESTLSSRPTCHCGKSFARKEHLTRHQATHSRPTHICNVCQRRFTRRELLRRHAVLHDPGRTRIVRSCDTCRTNKTKCSGSHPCLLCVRRGIECTFDDRHDTLRREPSSQETVVENTSRAHDNYDEQSSSMVSSRPNDLSSCTSTEAADAPRGQEWLHDLLIVPSQPSTTLGHQSLSPGMDTLYDLLRANETSIDAASHGSDEMQEWLATCLKTYFTKFHLQWPVLNAPSFDVTAAPLFLAASVCVIGTWLQDTTNRNERPRVLRVHNLLMQRLLQHLIDPETMPEGHAWPIEFLEAVLLTLMFSLYRTDQDAVTSTMLLRSVFITVLREKGVLDAKILASHLRTHFTGTFAPYTISMREKFRRLVVLTYQFDAYFALAHGKPPILHRQEIGTELTITFALWNSHGLDVFAKRLLDEPTDRTGFQISTMTDSPDSFTSSQLLVEDIITGLCGTLQAIWVFTSSSQTNSTGNETKRLARAPLVEILNSWKDELDKIKSSIDTMNITSDATKQLLLAYRGEDDSAVASLERVTVLAQDGLVLYYFLRMLLYARSSSDIVSSAPESTPDPLKQHSQTTQDRRQALLSALQIFRLITLTRGTNAPPNPLNRHALVKAAGLTRRTLINLATCECLAEGLQRAPEPIPERWIEHGGPLQFDGTKFCYCKLALWVGKFDKAIRDQDTMMEAADDTIR